MAKKKLNKLVSPIVKWVGGKRQLLKDIEKHLPQEVYNSKTTYYEPFIGGGAVLFHLQPNKAVINDTNSELVNLYKVIRDCPEDLIDDLKKHKNEEEYFYEIRGLDRDKEVYKNLSNIERASRIVFLNKTCYNGLFRVNSAGEFNTPFGRYKNPNIVNDITIRAIHNYFSNNDINILNTDYSEVLNEITPSSFVYLDPPYDPVSNSANFTGYTKGGFDKDEQIRLKKHCDHLDEKGVHFLLSNSSTDFINGLYKNYKIFHINANRAVNSKAEKRGAVKEVLVRNYEFKED
ncbi:MAG: DNA adenine methylase [Spirochaetales bacterium]|uniref:Site-specific DNA-methyltransferase (adenine-specific) n=1 Tax=Candidatus Thalassospirochaeta sargassi TaxID=3119039 RepID=A0AAJ1IIE7_9SPIO|nr:DNA adenine methylase [Spirochaetales bacterium]